MKKSLRMRFTTSLLATLLLAPVAVADPVDNAIRLRIEDGRKTELPVAGTSINALPGLRRFYEARAFEPAWTEAGGDLNAEAAALVAEIRRSGDEGLNPDDYHLPTLEALADGPASAGRQVDLELLLTDAWLVLASHYLSGRVDPVTIDPEWVPSRRNGDFPAMLERALGEGRTVAELRALLPRQPGYARLRELLADYRSRSGEAPSKIPPGDLIRPGKTDARVPALRQRLLGVAGDGTGDTLYDERLAGAVEDFQRAHGLEADGIVGPSTLGELNASDAERIDRILANLERWRWMPEELGRRHVRINIAGFRLEAWQDGALLQSMKVIVGRSYRRSPLFSDQIRYLVFNPAWEVPPKIAVQDKLPQLRKDPESLSRAGFVVLDGRGVDEVGVDPASIDWSTVDKGHFPYRLRQKPGPGNALGRVKIMFPNRFNVYLHDTSNPELFTRDVRTFSSGCIRLEHPIELSQWLLGETPGWTDGGIEEAIASGETRTVLLKQPVPVHLQYWTAWVDDEGKARFVDDIYRRDAPLAAALRAGIRR